MKTLITIALFQTGVLLVILFRLPASEPANIEPSPETRAVTSAENPFARQQPEASTVSTATSDDARLRAIVREEIERALAGLDRPAAAGRGSGTSIVASPPVDPEQRLRVMDQIEYFRGMGEISPQDMNELMSDIARLDEQGRREALSRLTTALNRQEIDGRF
ncbi:MAG: hypothetical protein R3270_06235 [Gammaproteobacteria bacterium]|nr:hypothetical protein [Gammaproteobacteria bacterium]